MTDEIVNAVLARWGQNFSSSDLEGMVGLYAPQVLFFGSNARLIADKDAVRAYFARNFDGAQSCTVGFTGIQSVRCGDDCIALAGHATFTYPAQVVTMRLTFSLVRAGDAWLIATHHVSLTPVIAGLTRDVDD